MFVAISRGLTGSLVLIASGLNIPLGLAFDSMNDRSLRVLITGRGGSLGSPVSVALVFDVALGPAFSLVADRSLRTSCAILLSSSRVTSRTGSLALVMLKAL